MKIEVNEKNVRSHIGEASHFGNLDHIYNCAMAIVITGRANTFQVTGLIDRFISTVPTDSKYELKYVAEKELTDIKQAALFKAGRVAYMKNIDSGEVLEIKSPLEYFKFVDSIKLANGQFFFKAALFLAITHLKQR